MSAVIIDMLQSSVNHVGDRLETAVRVIGKSPAFEPVFRHQNERIKLVFSLRRKHLALLDMGVTVLLIRHLPVLCDIALEHLFDSSAG